MRRKLVLTLQIIVLVGLITFLIITQDSYGQSTGWSQPVVISSVDESQPWFPDVATDKSGLVHVFWASGTKGLDSRNYDTVNYCQPTLSGCDKVVNVVTWGGSGYASRPAAIVNNSGLIHLLWHGSSTIYYNAAKSDEALSASNWSKSYKISGNMSYYSALAVDKNNTLHAVWNQIPTGANNATCPVCKDIFYRQSPDNGKTWLAPVDLSNTFLDSKKPQIVTAPDKSVYVTWSNTAGSEGQIPSAKFVASYDAGLTWEPAVTFIGPDGTSGDITIGVDGQNKIVVVWNTVNGSQIYYQVSSDKGKSWSPPKSLPGVLNRGGGPNLDGYHMAADSAGNLHLVVIGQDPAQETESSLSQSYHVFHFEWDGINWSEPTSIYEVVGDLPEWPRIAVGNGNQLHVVWFVRNQSHIWNAGEAGIDYKVWYATGKSSAPAIAPVKWPTATPIPTPNTQAVMLVPTPTPVPTLFPVPALNDGISVPDTVDTIYTETDELIVLGISLLPAVLIITVVMIIVKVSRD